MSNTTVFAKIIKNEIPSYCIYEDDYFKVILDRFPSVLGHTIIIPKHEATDIYDLDEESAERIFLLAQKVVKTLKERFDPDGFNILQNNGTAAGQSVFYFHLHVIPRYENDTTSIEWDHLDITDEKMQEIKDILSPHFQ